MKEKTTYTNIITHTITTQFTYSFVVKRFLFKSEILESKNENCLPLSTACKVMNSVIYDHNIKINESFVNEA